MHLYRYIHTLCISAGTPMALYCPRTISAGTILSSGSPFQLALPRHHLVGSSLLDNHPHKQGPELLDTFIESRLDAVSSTLTVDSVQRFVCIITMFIIHASVVYIRGSSRSSMYEVAECYRRYLVGETDERRHEGRE